ncbi:hypothetical protein QOZ80_9AG0693330 [Eleusine coracana subsp. coracana]|nr:hypothetical protein QOZ80_9AG0693330 [Eleusine coracana subsp. coracana]
MEDDDATTSSLVDLYCHEAPLMVSTLPSTEHGDADHQQQVQDLLLDNDDDDESLIAEYMARQRCYAPSRSYLDHLRLSASSSSSLPDDGTLSYARSRGVHYIVYAFGRLQLGLAASTAFNAVNYLDRFLAINYHIQKWETWMIELVSLACLSIACKLDEVNVPSLHQLQMEEVMSHSFRPATIRDMELTLLKALQWRIACVTPFSFLQLLLPLITCTAASRCTRLLICSLSETSLLRFDPSVIASSAIRCVIPQNHHQAAHVSSNINSFFFRPECPLEKDSDDECFNTMKTLYASLDWSNHQMYSSDLQRSPVSVFPCIGITESTVVKRSVVSRCLFGRTIPHQVSTKDEDSVPPSDTYTRDEVISNI